MNFIKKIIQKQDFLSFAGNLSYAILGFVSFLLLTRSFEKDIFGEWVLFITTSNFIGMFRFGITRTAIVRFLSGADKKQEKILIGSNWLISIVITIILIIIVWLSYFFAKTPIDHSGFKLFFRWYPLFAIANLPLNNALTVLQAKLKFGNILFLRTLNIFLFDLFLVINLLYLHCSVTTVAIVLISLNALTSVISLIKQWDGLRFLNYASRKVIKEVLDFGKYTTGTLIGSNLLKSADTFIIGLSPFLGTTGVALYSIPMKLTEIMEIPLRSFANTAFPKMSKASIQNNLEEVKRFFYTYSGSLLLLFIPFSIINFILAPYFVVFLGGEQYLDTTNIYRLFAIYGLILPLDRFTGVALDAINKPKQNFHKVNAMVFANIVGDLIAVFVFHSVFGVALITILMTLVGIIFGYYFLHKEITLNFYRIFKDGFSFLMHFKRNL